MRQPVTEPHDWTDENGTVRHAAIATYGDTIHSFISYNTFISQVTAGDKYIYVGNFYPALSPQEVEGDPTGIMMVDHIVGNVELGKMN